MALNKDPKTPKERIPGPKGKICDCEHDDHDSPGETGHHGLWDRIEDFDGSGYPAVCDSCIGAGHGEALTELANPSDRSRKPRTFWFDWGKQRGKDK